MVHATAFGPAKLIPFESDLLGQPFQDVRFVHLAGQFRARNISEVVDARGYGPLRDYRYIFLLPNGWLGLRDSNGIEEVRQWNCQEVRKLSDQLGEEISSNH